MKKIKVSQISKATTLFIVLSALAALAANTVLFSKNGTSQFRLIQGADDTRTVERIQDNFDVRRFFTATSEEMYLVSSKKTLVEYLDAEGMSGTVAWDVRHGARFETTLWSKSEQATELHVHNEYPVLVSGLGGCCAEMTGYRLYNLTNGKLLMSFNDYSFSEHAVTQPFSLEVPNSPLAIRYIGIISQDSTRDRDFVPPAPGKSAAILVKYANESLKQKLQIDMQVLPGYGIGVMELGLEVDPAAVDADKIEIEGKRVRLWNIDGATSPSAVTGVLLKIVLNGGEDDKVIKIPVKGDQLDISSASLPIGVSINAVQ